MREDFCNNINTIINYLKRVKKPIAALKIINKTNIPKSTVYRCLSSQKDRFIITEIRINNYANRKPIKFYQLKK